MRSLFVVGLLLLICCAAIPTELGAQTVSFFGQVYSSASSAASGEKAYLYSASSAKWYGPVITDSLGRFSFFNVPGGRYLLRVYTAGSKQPAFQQEVTVPGKITLHLSAAALAP
jgi:hypothetical protein